MKTFKSFLSSLIKENNYSLLKHVADVKTGMKDADFWITRKGSIENVGKPTNEFSHEHIGIKVNPEVFEPKFLFHAMQYVHSTGHYKPIAKGTLNLKHISIDDVKNIPLG